MINGVTDYTICYFDYSSLMALFWYDTPDLYEGKPKMEWFENLQTVFDESHVLDGMPGENVTMARRYGKEWFVGMLTNNEGSTEKLNCNFLEKGQTYLASVYMDGGEEVKTKTHVKYSYVLVKAGDVIVFNLKHRGEAAIRLVPVTEEDRIWENKVIFAPYL